MTSTTDTSTAQTLRCDHCDRHFGTKQAHRIRVRGPHSAEISCPHCRRLVFAEPPDEIPRPPQIVCKTIKTDGKLVTTRLFFSGGSWLQFRETANGWVHEEMFNEGGEEIESFPVEIEQNSCKSSRIYLERELNRYPTYTITGLRIERPHIAAVLIHGH